MNNKIEKFDRTNLKMIQRDLTETLKEFGSKYGITMELAGSVRFESNDFTVKIKGTASGAPIGIDAKMVGFEKAFKVYATMYRVLPEAFGAEIILSGKKFTLVGLNPKARKNCFVIADAQGKLYNTTDTAVLYALPENLKVQPIVKEWGVK